MEVLNQMINIVLILLLTAVLIIISLYYAIYTNIALKKNRIFLNKPKVYLFIPCKDNEKNLYKNIESYANQDYKNYMVIFITATADDPACSAIHEIVKKYSHCVHFVAGINNDYSQKVNNIINATENYQDCDIFAFGDSDICPNKEWLKNLITPLKMKKIGATTGYRWYWNQKRSFWQNVAIMWNGFVLFYMTIPFLRFIWGGSYAVRSDVFRNLNVRDIWHNVVTEDFTLSNAILKKGYRIHYVPQCLTVSLADFDSSSMFEWTTRQLMLSKYYFRRVYFSSLIVGLFGLLLVVNISWAFILGYVFLGFMLLRYVNITFNKIGCEIRVPYFMSVYILFSCILLIANVVFSFVSNKIKWRGVTYSIISHNKMIVEKVNTKEE